MEPTAKKLHDAQTVKEYSQQENQDDKERKEIKRVLQPKEYKLFTMKNGLLKTIIKK